MFLPEWKGRNSCIYQNVKVETHEFTRTQRLGLVNLPEWKVKNSCIYQNIKVGTHTFDRT